MPVVAALSATVGARIPSCRPCRAIQSATRATSGSLSWLMRPRWSRCQPCRHSSGSARRMAGPTWSSG
eukprot:2609998-Alexandrium_andersonii.AAC.1